MTEEHLSEKVALVTGSTRGIGRAIVEELAKAGATVVVSARREKDVAETVSEMQSQGFRFWARPATSGAMRKSQA